MSCEERKKNQSFHVITWFSPSSVLWSRLRCAINLSREGKSRWQLLNAHMNIGVSAGLVALPTSVPFTCPPSADASCNPGWEGSTDGKDG